MMKKIVVVREAAIAVEMRRAGMKAKLRTMMMMMKIARKRAMSIRKKRLS